MNIQKTAGQKLHFSSSVHRQFLFASRANLPNILAYTGALHIGASLQKYEEISRPLESGCTEIHTKSIKPLKIYFFISDVKVFLCSYKRLPNILAYRGALHIGANLQKYEEISRLFLSRCTEIHTDSIKPLKIYLLLLMLRPSSVDTKGYQTSVHIGALYIQG